MEWRSKPNVQVQVPGLRASSFLSYAVKDTSASVQAGWSGTGEAKTILGKEGELGLGGKDFGTVWEGGKWGKELERGKIEFGWGTKGGRSEIWTSKEEGGESGQWAKRKELGLPGQGDWD